MRDPIHVDFSSVDDFVAELERHEAVSWDTVRLALQLRFTGTMHFKSMTVVATAIVGAGSLLLRLRQYVGELTGLDTDRTTEAAGRRIMVQVEQAAARRNLQVRGGMFSCERGV